MPLFYYRSKQVNYCGRWAKYIVMQKTNVTEFLQRREELN